MKETRYCELCQKTYPSAYLLRLHLRRIHADRKFACYHCDYRAKLKHVLKAHIFRAHSLERKACPPRQNKYSSCPLCDWGQLTDRSGMLKHYEAAHEVDITESILDFNNIDDYHDWKRNLELSERCQFVVASGERKTSEGVTKYLRCSRDGTYKVSGAGKRKPKTKGSIKTNFVCPCSMKSHFATSGNVQVCYIKTHVGHECDTSRLKLSESEKIDLIEKLAANVPIDKILNSIREAVPKGNQTRLQLTSRKDLFNLKRRLHRTALKDCLATEEAALPYKVSLGPGDTILIVQEADTLLEDLSPENCPMKQPRRNLEKRKQKLITTMTKIIESVESFEEYNRIKKALLYYLKDFE